MDLKSSVNIVGDKVTQIIHFSNGNKRTITNIVTKSIKQGEFTKMNTNDRMILINTKNVDMVEVFPQND